MPPFLPRKRLRSSSPAAGSSKPSPSKPPPKKAAGDGKLAGAAARKPTLFEDLDAGLGKRGTAEHGKALLEKLAAAGEEEDDDDDSSISSLSSAEFEDVPSAKRQKIEDETEDEDEDIEFEDVQTHVQQPAPSAPAPSGDLELTLRKDTRISLTNPHGTKKGPSKIERGIRIATHQMHVQMLMWHNALRNAWLCDKEVQNILVGQLSPSILLEVERWRRNSGLPALEDKDKMPKPKGKGKAKVKGGKGKKVDPRSQRDWGEPAERLGSGEVNISSGDPLFRLLTVLTTYWKQRFRISAPGLRKMGYMSLERLDAEMKSFNNEKHDPELHGERIRDIDEFREHARRLEGSRDVGAQLFTALLRGLGVEARMVANLQPVGFSWTQHEEATEKNPRKLKKKVETNTLEDDSSDDGDSSEEEPVQKPVKKGKDRIPVKPKKVVKTPAKPTKKSSRRSGAKDEPIDLSESEPAQESEDDESVIDVTPARPRSQPSLPYDKDLLFPHYWTEVLSPVTNTYTPVDVLVLNIIVTKVEALEKFEPRGAKSEKAKQVTSYIIGHSSDGTAKDVTTRYLKRHIWPGRTKGNRIAVEKIPVHSRHGKVKHYEEYDWFKTVMSGYSRGSAKCPRTEIDDHEDATILKPVKPVKKEVEEGKETLQSYKSSAEFVLERHLKREEALVPGSTHVKMFTIKGKGEDSIEEKVYLRKDVVHCKSMETWHKEGRAPIPGEQPLKRVPYRAATTNRRRELAEAEQATGGKPLQGLFSRAQTDWIIPPPIQDGIIPKNSFGNIDLYVDSMLPAGAVHIPKRQTMKICKRIGIDYAEAVVGFEFGHRMAVPIISGVVVAEENYELVMEEWEKDEAERVRKEDEKRTRTAVGLWRKMLMGMRIIKRVREEYGEEVDNDPDALNPWTNNRPDKKVDEDVEKQARIMEMRDEDMAGGFLPEGHDEEDPDEHDTNGSSFFPVAHEDDDGGGFVIEGHDDHVTKSGSGTGNAYATPQSLDSRKAKNTTADNDDHGEDEDGDEDDDEEMQDVASEESDAPAPPPPKKRGRLAGSANKLAKSTPKSTTKPLSTKKSTPKTKPKATPKSNPKSKAKATTQTKTPTSKKRKRIADSADEDEGDEDSSSLSELGSDSDSEESEALGKKLVGVAGRARRASARVVRSRYFEGGDDDDDDVEED